jgi:hypothetical protein
MLVLRGAESAACPPVDSSPWRPGRRRLGALACAEQKQAGVQGAATSEMKNMNTLRLSHARAGATVQRGAVARGQQPLHDGGWEPGEVRGRGTVEGQTAGGWERDVLGVWREGGSLWRAG